VWKPRHYVKVLEPLQICEQHPLPVTSNQTHNSNNQGQDTDHCGKKDGSPHSRPESKIRISRLNLQITRPEIQSRNHITDNYAQYTDTQVRSKILPTCIRKVARLCPCLARPHWNRKLEPLVIPLPSKRFKGRAPALAQIQPQQPSSLVVCL
jgi:hypothetical protein